MNITQTFKNFLYRSYISAGMKIPAWSAPVNL